MLKDIIIATLFLFVLLFVASNYEKPIGRFVPIGEAVPNLALDTRTGQLCWSYDPIKDVKDSVPLCKNIR